MNLFNESLCGENQQSKKGICMSIDNLLRDAGAQFLLRT
ncbi:hypothetical protein HMPREF1492_0160 [Atopobium sp. BS2]|nr:hypothetical protein HMPREF1492_0160 [Atopobium sp. BS2]